MNDNPTSPETPAPAPKTKSNQIGKLLIGLAVVIVVLLAVYPFVKHTGPGRMLRGYVTGQPVARFETDDLAEEVGHKPGLAPLQDWSVKTLARYRSGEVATNGTSIYGSPFVIDLAPKEIPDWLTASWPENKPEVSVLLNDESQQPECIIVGWRLGGLLVGSSDYVTKFRPRYIIQARPGIYAFSLQQQ